MRHLEAERRMVVARGWGVAGGPGSVSWENKSFGVGRW